MGAVATFVYADWIAIYPEFSPSGTQPVVSQQATNYFNMATIFQVNDGSGPVADAATQTTLLYALTAHIAALNANLASGAAPPPLVGRINSASEGSVSVGAEFNVPAGTAQWYAQTKYGAMWWAMTAGYRLMNYRRGPDVVPAQQGFSQNGYGGYGRW